MNLKNIFGSNKKQPQAEYFLAVEIHESLIKSVCWEIVEGEPQIAQMGSFEAWEDEESLINGVDASITEAVKNLGVQPRRVILGLPESWFESNNIHTTKKGLIKKLLDALALEAIGVVSTTQAITHYLKKKEGIPPTAILLEIFQTKVVVSVVKLGKVEDTEEVGVSGDLARDVEEGLARMEFDRLPARFLLTDGSSLEEEQQQLISYPWQEKLPFIHMPKVEVLPIDFSIKAIAMTGGTEAAESIGIEIKEDAVEEAMPKEESNITLPDNTPAPDLEKLGFAYEETTPPEGIPASETIEKSSSSETAQINHLVSISPEDNVEDAQYAVPTEEVEKQKKQPRISLPKPRNIFSNLRIKLPSLSVGNKPVILFVGLTAVILLVGVVGGYFFFGKADVTVYVSPQKIDKEIIIAIAETQQSGTPTLVATKKTVSSQTQETIATTGETNVGEKASGSITIANKTVAPVALKSGTTITTENGKNTFIIQDAVTVASKSADPLTFQETYGKATGVKVIASKIGAELNLSKDTTFSVDNFSKTIVYAVAESDFTGGTSRVVKAVAKKDQDALITQASEKIKLQTQAELSQADPNTSSLPLNELTFTKKTFNHAVGEEASTVTLDMAGSVDLLVYSNNDLFNLVSSQIKPQLPPGASLSQTGSNIRIENPVKGSNNIYNAKAIIQASLVPDFDTNQWANIAKGKKLSDSKDMLMRIPGYKSTSAKMSPPIPFLSTIFLPLKNISVRIVSQ